MNKKRILWLMYDIKSFIKHNNPISLIKRKIWAKKYYKKPVIDEINMKRSSFDIYTVAFNNVEVIDYQIRLLKKHLKDEHFHIIADNSNDKEKTKKIKKLCIKYEVWYIKLPENVLFCSLSHWVALNYLYRNYIKKRKTEYFWFLDHDIFPIKDTSILDHFWNQDFYGYLVDKHRRWYIYGKQRMLRPWFSFYKYWVFRKFNFFTAKWFFPKPYALDTWWWNRRLIFKNYNKDKIKFTERKLIWIDKNWIERETSYSIIIDGKLVEHDFVEIYELVKNWEWIHRWWTFCNYNDKNEVAKLNNEVANFLNRLDKYL